MYVINVVSALRVTYVVTQQILCYLASIHGQANASIIVRCSDSRDCLLAYIEGANVQKLWRSETPKQKQRYRVHRGNIPHPAVKSTTVTAPDAILSSSQVIIRRDYLVHPCKYLTTSRSNHKLLQLRVFLFLSSLESRCGRFEQWLAVLCLVLCSGCVSCDDNGDYGLKVEYNPALLNKTGVSTERAVT